MAGFPTEKDWRSSPAGYVNEAARLCVWKPMFFFSLAGNKNLIWWFLCIDCGYVTHVEVHMSTTCPVSLRPSVLLAHAAVLIEMNAAPGIALRTHTHTQAPSQPHPSGLRPQMTLLGQKLPLEGKHAHTENLKQRITTQKWPVPKLHKTLWWFLLWWYIDSYSVTTSLALSGIPKALSSPFQMKVGQHPGTLEGVLSLGHKEQIKPKK